MKPPGKSACSRAPELRHKRRADHNKNQPIQEWVQLDEHREPLHQGALDDPVIRERDVGQQTIAGRHKEEEREQKSGAEKQSAAGRQSRYSTGFCQFAFRKTRVKGVRAEGTGRKLVFASAQRCACYLCTAVSLSGPDSRRRLAVCRILCLSSKCRKLRTDIFSISAARV
jgi:hypothetical protein